MSGRGVTGKQIRDDTLTGADIAEDAIGASEIGSDSICGQEEITSLNDDDYILVSKTDDSGNLKRVQIQNLPAGSSSSTIIQSTEHGYSKSGNNLIYVPWYQTTEKTAPNYLDQHIVPFDGRLLKVYVRSSRNNMGSTILGIHLNDPGQSEVSTSAVEAITSVVPDDAVGIFEFSAASHFSAGDIVGISIDPTGDHKDVNVTCVWEYTT